MAAYINRIASAVPENDIHLAFCGYAEAMLPHPTHRALFRRMASRSQIQHRWSALKPPGAGADDGIVDADGFYQRGAFPSTAARMRRYEADAPALAFKALERLGLDEMAGEVTHLILTTCTGFSAPGLDIEIVERFGLAPSVERTSIGFMGCYAAVNALKLARHIVRSEPKAKVLLVSLELCSLHLQETEELEQSLTFMIFGDGCAAALVSAEPEGLLLDGFHVELDLAAREQITWKVRDLGFDMVLSGQVPAAVGRAVRQGRERILGGLEAHEIDLWAVHPGGRSVLDAVEEGLALPQGALAPSREVLAAFGNMSSATVLFVLETIMRGPTRGLRGCGMAFGPGLSAETFTFSGAAA